MVNYSYLADGTKVRAFGADGKGLEYRGSLTFTRNSFGRLMPESIAFPGGRFVAKKNDEGLIMMVPHYYITDHLGSVRVVIDGSSDQIVEANDYYPFGGRWDDDSLQDQANRYRYNGKEEQSVFGSAYSDYGARQYSASTGRWLSMDPLSEKYYGISPYAFCNNNPVNLVDPDGRYFDKSNARKADRYERRIERKADRLDKQATRKENRGKDVGDLRERIKELHKSAQDIRDMRNDTDTEYRFAESSTPISEYIGQNGHGDNVIKIAAHKSDFGTIVHEVRHGGQHARGELDIKSLQNYGIDHEIDAYRAQYSWSGQLECLFLDPADSRYSVYIESNVPYLKLISNIGEINYNFIIHIIEDWKYLYRPLIR